jgi:hypothetical protein
MIYLVALALAFPTSRLARTSSTLACEGKQGVCATANLQKLEITFHKVLSCWCKDIKMSNIRETLSHDFMNRAEELVVQYCSRYNLQNWTITKLLTAYRDPDRDYEYDPKNWRGSDESAKSGVYFIYAIDGELLYVGKSSQSDGITVGYRLWDHCRKKWDPKPAYVKILVVENDFEACSLEEFLIKKLHPRFNKTANRSRKAA